MNWLALALVFPSWAALLVADLLAAYTISQKDPSDRVV